MANGLLIANVSGITSTPSLAVFFDAQDYYGNWVLTSNATSVNGSAITGTGTYGGAITTTAGLLAFNGRIRWTVSGTNPSFTTSFDMFGR